MKTLTAILLITLFLSSCGKDPVPPTPAFSTEYQLPDRPEAMAAYDNSNYGIYKGVVINAQDSTATYKFNLYNYSAQPYALLYTGDKVQDSLVRYQKDNNGYILLPQKADTTRVPLNGPFYYTYFSSYNIGHSLSLVGFNVSAFGNGYQMSTQLYGNSTLNAILKEKSNNQVFCYEGSYNGSDSGRIAFVMSTDSIVAIRASVWSPQFFKLATAHVTNGSFTLLQPDDVSGNTFTFTGTVQNNTCLGTWTKSSIPSVVNQFKAVRTL